MPKQCYTHLSAEDRETLSLGLAHGHSLRRMASVLGRSPSTISRELLRNAQPAGYASTAARTCALQRRRQGRAPNKLHREGILFDVMRHFLGLRWSPDGRQLAFVEGGADKWIYYAPKTWDGDDIPEYWETRRKQYNQIMDEDMMNMAPMQRSLESPALTGIPINYQERRIWHLHETIDAMIGPENIPEDWRVPPLLEPYLER